VTPLSDYGEVSDVIDRICLSIRFRAPDGLLMKVATDVPGFAVEETA
jgi:hypothetical protein